MDCSDKVPHRLYQPVSVGNGVPCAVLVCHVFVPPARWRRLLGCLLERCGLIVLPWPADGGLRVDAGEMSRSSSSGPLMAASGLMLERCPDPPPPARWWRLPGRLLERCPDPPPPARWWRLPGRLLERARSVLMSSSVLAGGFPTAHRLQWYQLSPFPSRRTAWEVPSNQT